MDIDKRAIALIVSSHLGFFTSQLKNSRYSIQWITPRIDGIESTKRGAKQFHGQSKSYLREVKQAWTNIETKVKRIDMDYQCCELRIRNDNKRSEEKSSDLYYCARIASDHLYINLSL